MSHFTVAVLSHSRYDVDSLLAPYNEQTEDPNYLEFEPASETIEEMQEKYRERGEEYDCFSDFVSSYYGYTYDEESGQWGYMCNPNSKWDWYQIGGRWMGALKLKPGCVGYNGEPSWCNSSESLPSGRCDQALLKDVDLSPDPKEYAKALRYWEVVVEGQPRREDESERSFYSLYKPEYYTQRYRSKEDYAEQMAEFSTWALVTPDGEWLEKGSMGWWGMSDANAESISEYRAALNRILAENPDVWITIVDCHI